MTVTSVQLTMCLDNGEFYPNFVGCAECSRTDVLHVENRVTQQDDDEETVIYERMVTHFYSAPQCSHCKRCTSYSNSVRLSVRPSVCLSHASIVSKGLYIARCSLHCQTPKCV